MLLQLIEKKDHKERGLVNLGRLQPCSVAIKLSTVGGCKAGRKRQKSELKTMPLRGKKRCESNLEIDLATKGEKETKK